jgi:hypothetical protein
MIVIGSVALNKYRSTKKRYRDIDIVCVYKDAEKLKAEVEAVGGKTICFYPLSGTKIVWKFKYLHDVVNIVEFEIAYPGSTAEWMIEYTAEHKGAFVDVFRLGTTGSQILIAPLEILFSLKMSHRYLKNSPHFNKTRQDAIEIRALLSHNQLVTLETKIELRSWYARREAETLDYGHPKLNQKKDAFFTDEVGYIYDHDTIHEAMAIGEKPAYKAYQKPGSEISVSKELWDELPLEKQIYGVIEEAYVLALERHQIPNDFTPDPVVSFDKALEKVCTSITSGWFREFAWEYYDVIKEIYSPNYVGKFKVALANGVIKSYK